MSQAIIALIILAVVMVLFVSEALPLPVTALFGAIAMAVFGIIGFDQAFAGFGSDTLMMVAGMLVIGQAVYESGVVDRMGGLLRKLVSMGERSSIALVSLVAGLLSAFMSNTAIVASILPMVDSLAESSGKRSLRTGLAMSVGAAAILGGSLTLVGSTPQLVAQGILESSGGETLGFFTLLKGALPLFVLGIAYYATVGRRLLALRADIPAQGEAVSLPIEEEPKARPSTRKAVITAATFAACVAGFVAGMWTVGTVALAGALFLIAMGCIDMKSVVRNVDWSAVVILGGSLGFSAGLEESGAGALVANTIIDLCGGAAANPLAIFAAMVVITAVLSNFMSNTAVVAMLAPMGLFLAETMGFNPITMVVGIVLAASICLATPIGSPPMTLTLSAGYRFGDYLKVGAPLCVLLVLATIVVVPLLYGVS
ncbi:SLC13/DASS family transporter [Eggerthella guodeyinii]|uniref:SLC13/DASS family transporter n=1 Tax=Eggerthella guodeyinii TaxID=2690837 RepID=A0A6L7ISB0_9ACTN|nr:SLC13 family permease [Eggerthella guodeyinii]QOS67642.1 SLC13/DASS family transporter [Eggerthella guodeyinii]